MDAVTLSALAKGGRQMQLVGLQPFTLCGTHVSSSIPTLVVVCSECVLHPQYSSLY